jgi:hypothetical protein
LGPSTINNVLIRDSYGPGFPCTRGLFLPSPFFWSLATHTFALLHCIHTLVGSDLLDSTFSCFAPVYPAPMIISPAWNGIRPGGFVALTTRHPLSAKIASTSGSRSVGIVRLRTKATQFECLCVYEYYHSLPHNGINTANMLTLLFSPVNNNFNISWNFRYCIKCLILLANLFVVLFYVLLLSL